MKGTTLTINKVLCQELAHPVCTSKKTKNNFRPWWLACMEYVWVFMLCFHICNADFTLQVKYGKSQHSQVAG